MLLGGVLTSALSWEWIFFINVPVGAVALVLSPILLTESRDAHGQTFDVPGAVLVTGGLTTLVYAITEGRGWGWTRRTTIAVFALAAGLLAAFIPWESRGKDPLVPFSIFRHPDAHGRQHRRLHPWAPCSSRCS